VPIGPELAKPYVSPLPQPALRPAGEYGAPSYVAQATGKSVPLCVDLDGTLLKTDLLFESLARLLRQKPWFILLVPFWCLQGRARLKQNVARRIAIHVPSLPYHKEFLEWLRSQKVEGRRLMLVTAADQSIAREIANHLGIFDAVWASDGRRNLKGNRKLQLLRKELRGEFEYAGNSRSDLEIWRHCSHAITVGASPSLVLRVRRHVATVATFDGVSRRLTHYTGALRCHQWAKNVLIFVPLLTSHQFMHPVLLWKATLSALLFSLCASAQYILNDLMDLDADRQHRIKRTRPFANGDLPLETGFILAPALLGLGLAGALVLSPLFAAVLGIYFVLSLAYSLHIKKVILLDAFVLSGLYTLRIIGGHVVTGVAFSVWLLSFAFFLFLSLAFSKRWTELNNAQHSTAAIAGRGYEIGDIGQINLFGVCSAFLSAVVFILYLQSENVKELYQQPQLLWFLSPIYLYWVSRLWVLSARGNVSEDPVLFVLKDPVTYVITACAGLIMLAAKTGWLRMLAGH
jgi:4-hydroxybenzoate polyprenyltransferase